MLRPYTNSGLQSQSLHLFYARIIVHVHSKFFEGGEGTSQNAHPLTAGFHTGFWLGRELGGPLKPCPPDLTPAKVMYAYMYLFIK